MKKYKTLASKWLAILSLTCFFILISGVILMVLHFRNVSLQICLMTVGGMLCFLFSICYFAEKNRTLTTDSNTVVFPSGATVNGKMTFKKKTVNIGEISSIERKLHEGDKILAEDAYFYTIELKNGIEIIVTLYAYGKEAEVEIFEFIKNRIS